MDYKSSAILREIIEISCSSGITSYTWCPSPGGYREDSGKPQKLSCYKRVGWVFFRIENVKDAFVFVKRLFVFDFSVKPNFSVEFYTFLCLAIFFAFFAGNKWGKQIHDSIFVNEYNIKKHLALTAISICFFILSVSSITSLGFNPFIYFRF